jgi:hypothetical protein
MQESSASNAIPTADKPRANRNNGCSKKQKQPLMLFEICPTHCDDKEVAGRRDGQGFIQLELGEPLHSRNHPA